MQQLNHIESTYHYYFWGFIVAFLFFNYPGESIYDPPLFKLNLLRA